MLDIALSRMPIRKRVPSAILGDLIPSLHSLVESSESYLTDEEAIAVIQALVGQIDGLRGWVNIGNESDNNEATCCNVSFFSQFRERADGSRCYYKS